VLLPPPALFSAGRHPHFCVSPPTPQLCNK
jgi:hypothetical protein